MTEAIAANSIIVRQRNGAGLDDMMCEMFRNHVGEV